MELQKSGSLGKTRAQRKQREDRQYPSHPKRCAEHIERRAKSKA